MHRLDHHYRVVNHNCDGKHKSGKGEEVKRESDGINQGESTNQRHRNSNSRDKGGAKVLKEDVYHDKHEDECLDKGLDKLVDRSLEEVVDIQRNLECKARRRLCSHSLTTSSTLPISSLAFEPGDWNTIDVTPTCPSTVFSNP